MSESNKSSDDSSGDELENSEQTEQQPQQQTGMEDLETSESSKSSDELENSEQTEQQPQQQTGMEDLEMSESSKSSNELENSEQIEQQSHEQIGTDEVFKVAESSKGSEDSNDDELEDNGGQTEQQAQQQHMGMNVSDDGEEEEVLDTGPVKIDLEMARSKADLGEEGPFFAKLPNFLSIDTKPFDLETYDDELEEDEMLDEEGRTRLKLKMENTIRWRIVRDEQGNEKRESNARIVRWSDGSMSMYLGGEVFEVDKQRIMDFNHLYIRQGAALQAQSVFAEKLVFRPHSTDTLTHRKMTMNMAEKTSKAQKVRMLANVGDNPDAQKKEMIRLEEEKLRAAARREAQQRRVRERPRAMGLTSGFLEGYDSDEGGAESLAAIKRRYQHAPYGVRGTSADRERSYYSESDEEREERRQRKTINEAKIDSDEEEDGGGEEMETSETEQRQAPYKSQSKEQQKKKIVIEEDEDE